MYQNKLANFKKTPSSSSSNIKNINKKNDHQTYIIKQLLGAYAIRENFIMCVYV